MRACLSIPSHACLMCDSKHSSIYPGYQCSCHQRTGCPPLSLFFLPAVWMHGTDTKARASEVQTDDQWRRRHCAAHSPPTHRSDDGWSEWCLPSLSPLASRCFGGLIHDSLTLLVAAPPTGADVMSRTLPPDGHVWFSPRETEMSSANFPPLPPTSLRWRQFKTWR